MISVQELLQVKSRLSVTCLSLAVSTPLSPMSQPSPSLMQPTTLNLATSNTLIGAPASGLQLGAEVEADNTTESESTQLLRLFAVLFTRIMTIYKLTEAAVVTILLLFRFILQTVSPEIANNFPCTIHRLKSSAKISTLPDPTVYAVCDVCHNTVLLEDASDLHEGTRTTKTCNNHRSRNRRYSNPLLRKTYLSRGKIRLSPRLCYRVLPPSAWLKYYMKNREFDGLLCHKLHHLQSATANRFDEVWDGRIWKEFLTDDNGTELLSDKYNFGLLMKIDWFHPFKHNQYKVAGIFMSVLDLPRSERMKQRWTMLVGVIPGPHEPEIHINSYLRPIVDDLLELYNGIPMENCDGTNQLVRALLLGVAADMPASRKVSQFLGHKADLGCSICQFRAKREDGRTAAGRMSYYTSYDDPAPLRQAEDVRRQAKEYEAAYKRSEKQARETAQRNGVRSSELLRLPYFDPIRMFPVDPMHTILTGLIQTEATLHFELPDISGLIDREMKIFQDRVRRLQVPHDVGRLPVDITDPRLSLSGLRASQWLHYGITYARVCLRDLLNPSIYDCYKTLIEACEVLLAYSLSEQDIQLLEERLIRHHQTFKEEYGEFQVKAKHHMALHIPQAIRDYGPVCNFWCFAYERLNGVMGQYVHSTTSPEVQIYKKFISDQAAAFEASQMATQLGSDTIETLPQQLKSLCQYQTGSTGNPSLMKMTLLSQLQCDDGNNLLPIQDALNRNEALFDDWPCKLLHPRQRDVRLHSDMYDSLKGYFSEIYSDKLCLVQARMTRYARCEVNGVTFSSLFNRTAKGSAAVVYRVTGDEGHPTILEPYYCSI